MANDMMVIEFSTTIVKSRPCEKFLADFCTSALLKALKIDILYSKNSRWSSFQKCRTVKVHYTVLYLITVIWSLYLTSK